MSTLCRAKWKLRNVRGLRPFYRAAAGRRRTRSPGGASRAALPVKDVFGGTPNTARETHALPIHLSALLDLLRRRWDTLQRRSAPVSGRSNVKVQISPGKPGRVRTVRACCARGRAHSAVVYPAALAVRIK